MALDANVPAQGASPAVNAPLETLRRDLHGRMERSVGPLARALAGLGVRPNHVTFAGLLLNLAAAALIVEEWLLAAGLAWLAAGAFDLLDGALARAGNTATAFGAFLDSTLDRLSEGVVLAAVAYHFAAHSQPGYAGLAVLALLGSVLVSYTRARAEALGVDCRVGVLTRAERVLILGLGLCLDLLALALWVLAALGLLTSAQRILYTRRRLSRGA